MRYSEVEGNIDYDPENAFWLHRRRGQEGRAGPERLVSAGGVVLRQGDGVVEVALCGRSRPRLWSLPKGTPADGETLEETALREVSEETGLEVAAGSPLGSISYWFARATDGARCHKTVHFYLMRATGGSTDRHDAEFDEVRWFPGAEALRAMSYPNETRVVERALDLLEHGEG